MRERPIIFSAPMVHAILAGTKTQTRSVVKLARDKNAEVAEAIAALPATPEGTDPPEEWEQHMLGRLGLVAPTDEDKE